jgi:formate hydrogenlyase subunit 3/multisubunit Na+/H+ antiporter MnhD subunit
MTGLLLVLTPLAPLLLLAAALHPALRPRLPGLLWLAPLPALAAALLAGDGPPLVMYAAWLRLTLVLDPPAALLLGVCALLWSAAGAYVAAYLGRRDDVDGFAVWWLLTMCGSLGVFVAADLLTFYLTFAVASLAAVGLIVHDGTERARRAAATTLLLVVLGEICLLFAFALLARAIPGPSLAITDAMAALPEAPGRGLILALLAAGFGLKAGLVPLHVWLPLAHPAAPMPASAVLSGAIVKAGVIGLLRFLPYDGTLTDWGMGLGAVGFLTAFWGVAVGITQANPKAVLAYSTVSQMGIVAAVIGFGLYAAVPGTAMAAAFYASHHVLAKGAMFLGIGVAAATGRRWFWPLMLAPALVLVLGFGGLPFTGGALAKAAVKAQIGDGLLGLLSALSAAGTTLLMLHALRRIATMMPEDPGARPPAGMVLPWLGLAAAAVLVPWLLFARAGGEFADVFEAGALWKAAWPVLLGAVLAAALWRWGGALPRLPEGDILGPVERLLSPAPASAGVARFEARLRAWPAAALALLVLVLAFGGLMATGAR